MSLDGTIDPREIASLKVAMGAELSSAERALCDESAQAFQEAVEFLGDLSAWAVPAGDPEGERRQAGPPDLIARFEASQVAEARRFMEGFPTFLITLLLAFSLAGALVVFFKVGTIFVWPAVEVMGFMSLLGGLFAFVVRQRAVRTLRESDLVAYLSSKEPRSVRRSPASWIVMGALLVIYGRQVAVEGWQDSTTFFVIVALGAYAASFLIDRSNQAKRMSQDAELWTWWYGEGESETES